MKKKRPSRPIVEVTRLRVERGGTPILRDVTWRVEAGQHWVILGANGSGKTSLLSALTGYLTPTAGDIHLLGQRYGQSDWRALRRHIGLVSSSVRQLMSDEEPGLEVVVSGKYAMIDLWGRVSAKDRRAGLRILHQVECAHLADRPWGFLSQGERQRLLIGRALMARPRLLILDEPCAGLDPVAREHFLQWMERLGRRKGAPTLVLVTHHVEEIMPVFSRAMVLRDGAVLASGDLEGVMRGPVFSKAFGSRVEVRQRDGRYGLKVASSRSVVI